MPVDARLYIETALQNGITILKRSFSTQPFKIADITEEKKGKELQLMLMSSSPGILDGDCYNMKMEIGEGCQLKVETQAYQRLFQMKKGASQEVQVNLKKGSSFTYLPHPVVPHQQSVFRTKSKVFLEEDCSLLWGEVLSCGRKLNGEVFQFSLYHGITEIFLNKKLVVKENLLLKPQQMNINSIGHLEGYTHQATLLFLDEEADIRTLVDKLSEVLNEHTHVAFGVSTLPVNGLIVRLLGYKAEGLFALLKKLSLLLQTRQKMFSKTSEVYVS